MCDERCKRQYFDTGSIRCKRTRRCHRGATDCVSSGWIAVPSAQNVETWSEHVDACTPVGEVCTTILECGCADSDGLFGTSRRVIAGVFVVVTSSDCNMETAIDSSIDDAIQRGRFAASKGQVSDAALEIGADASANLLFAKSLCLFICSPGKLSHRMPK
jgi:hypothetical protein